MILESCQAAKKLPLTSNIFCVPSDVIRNTVRTRLVRIAAGLRLERLTPGSTPVREPLYTGGFATAATPSRCCVAHRPPMSPAYPSWRIAFLGINQTTLWSFKTRRLWLALWSQGPFTCQQQRPVTALKKEQHPRTEPPHLREERQGKMTQRMTHAVMPSRIRVKARIWIG